MLEQFEHIGNLWVFPSNDHDKNTRISYADMSGPFAAMFISSPSMKHRAYCQAHCVGKSTVEVIVPASSAWFKQVDIEGSR